MQPESAVDRRWNKTSFTAQLTKDLQSSRRRSVERGSRGAKADPNHGIANPELMGIILWSASRAWKMWSVALHAVISETAQATRLDHYGALI